MRFANVGTLGTQPGKRDEVIAILTCLHPDLEEVGCLMYEVDVNEHEPDTVFFSELWESAEAHQNSPQLKSVQAAISGVMPLLTGEMGGQNFTVVGHHSATHGLPTRRDPFVII